MSEKTNLGRARGLNSIADPSDFKGRAGRRSTPEPVAAPSPDLAPAPAPTRAEVLVEPVPLHRAATPDVRRKRRELSVPHAVAQAVEHTGINPADLVMSGYRRHGDAIYAGAGGRMAARGRTRLRISITDAEFDQLTRLGTARGWNRSETVAVILAMELLEDRHEPR